ncbi:hypothetical protein APUTEX25_004440 [Auxenochlorella protothecoides]|uniref:PCI domain-containing protein n=1 Tax=Auxenochlorella protothecoides TaxID=3075 RepID=A0A3M7L3G8_AUXPR|nr:hypothetical protein APUTEX25_004440 [Auxenochlorella protothecoides]|eukprot:RMZ56016.1 hypothetical protein APUTEX25_004440 [Auxenochlorella protothecoides]
MPSDIKRVQYAQLARSLRGRPLAELISRATTEPDLATFGDLLHLTAVQELSNTEDAAALSLLNLFSYGQASGLRLTAAQERKLRALTVLSLAASRRRLAYAELLPALGLQDVRDLEDILVTNCIGAGLVRGRLDQAEQCLLVEESVARDASPAQLSAIAASLGAWLDSARGVAAAVEAALQSAVEGAAAEAAQQAQLAADIQAKREGAAAVHEADAEGPANNGLSGLFADESEMFSLESMGEGSTPGNAARLPKRRR